jgi:hypothetical protein
VAMILTIEIYQHYIFQNNVLVLLPACIYFEKLIVYFLIMKC